MDDKDKILDDKVLDEVTPRTRAQENCERIIHIHFPGNSHVILNSSRYLLFKTQGYKKVNMYNTNRYNVPAKGQRLSDWIFESIYILFVIHNNTKMLKVK